MSEQKFTGIVVLICDDEPDAKGNRHPGIDSITFPFGHVNVVWGNSREARHFMGGARLYAGEAEIGGKKVPVVLANVTIWNFPKGDDSERPLPPIEEQTISVVPGIEGQMTLDSIEKLDDGTQRINKVKLIGLSFDLGNADKRIPPVKISVPFCAAQVPEDK